VSRLADPAISVKALAVNLGFANPSHFGKWIRRRTGLSPGGLRRGVIM
jgi:AraC-like DNA-binding protein